MNKKIPPYLFAVSAVAVTILLSATLSALLLDGEEAPLPIPSDQQAADRMARAVMEAKCADCHGQNPTYNSIINLASFGMLRRHVENAQKAFTMKPDSAIRSGSVDYLKMDYVLRTRRMPPAAYSMVHLGSKLTPDDVKILRYRYHAEGAVARAFSPIFPAVAEEKDYDKIRLGHMLFYDPRLSANNKISCSTCHDLTKGGTDNLAKSEGVPGPDGKPQLGNVNAPSVYNAAGNIKQFWDGRAANLQEQAGGPPLNPVEMGYSQPGDWNEIAAKLSQDPELAELFASVYGEQGITEDTITDAIAAFELTLATPDSDFDRYLNGDQNALSSEQVEGMRIFLNYGCANCHAGPTLGGISFENINTHADLRSHAPGYHETAFGLQDFTKKREHRDMFRVPNLRNVALTAPYFHTGSIWELDEAVRMMFETQTGIAPGKSKIRAVTRFLEAQTGKLNGIPLQELKAEDVKIPGSTIPRNN